jgi:hypothetical protein
MNVGKKERGFYKRNHLQDYVETGSIFSERRELDMLLILA